jgi:hypothetical protein
VIAWLTATHWLSDETTAGVVTKSGDDTSDRATLVILAPQGPVLADLRVSVAKLPYRVWIGRFLSQQLDTDKNRELTESELKLLPARLAQMAGLDMSESVLAAAGVPAAAGAMTASRFAEWFSTRLPRAFDLIAQPQAADDAVRLASLLDDNGDGVVNETELQGAARALRFRDLDDDETWSVSELVPYRDPRSMAAALSPEVASLPFFYVTDTESANAAAERLVARYGEAGNLPAGRLRLPPHLPGEPSIEKSLDVANVASLFASPVHHLTLDVRLSDNANVSAVDVTIAPEAESFCSIRNSERAECTLLLDGLPLTVIARGGGRNNRAAVRGFLGQTFVMADGDKNQYLDEAEFPGLAAALDSSGVPGDFSSLDANQNKMVTRDEVFGHAEREQTAVASRIEVMVKQDGKTLFGLLDGNFDRRLSARELRSGGGVLKQYDLDGDNRFAETELGTEYVLTLGLGRPEFRRSATGSQMMPGMMMGGGDAILSGRDALSGPEWFKRMDRNQDGDVSRREFLGSAEQFTRLDADADGLLNASEAEGPVTSEPN